MQPYHTLSIEDTLKQLHVSKDSGLTKKEVQKRRQAYGYNRLAEKKEIPLAVRFFRQFADFMILILIAAAVISFSVSYLEGRADYMDPIIIFTIIILNAVIGTFQEAKAEKSLDALKKMAAPTAMVLRDGTQVQIPSDELVPGDIVTLETGSYVPADLRLLTCVQLKTDESSLTGESHGVSKDAGAVLPEHTPLAERINLVPAASMVIYGRGTGIVTQIGMQTEVGNIARMILTDSAPQTPLQKRLSSLGKGLGIAALLICAVIFVLGILEGRPVFDMFMTSVSLSVASIPEGLPVVVTIMLSLGVQTMAKENTVVRKLPAVETLGSATVICSDKTGTLTQNKMTVTALSSLHGEEPLESPFGKALLTYASLCSNSTIQRVKDKLIVNGDPTENAIILAGERLGISKSKLDLTIPRLKEMPFDSVRKRMSAVHKTEKGLEQITKGAFDMILPLCSSVYDNGKTIPIRETHKRFFQSQNRAMSDRALRVLAVAVKPLSSPDKLREDGLTLIGLIGMIDPPRPEVKAAVRTCMDAGIRPVMITGDHILTASAIGKELGFLDASSQAITGAQLDSMPDGKLLEEIGNYHVFARVSPEHKVRIVKAYQKQGNVVAMTGDGVNDAPALKAADIGCAMGLSGTDVAKNAADMILTDDNFATIVAAVREGRGIYDNIRKSIHFLLSSNIGELLTIFIAILFKLPTPLLAIHLLWINLITDSLPAIALGLEPPEKDIMKRPPTAPGKSMFADGLFLQIILEGMMIGSLALLAFITGYRLLGKNDLLLGRTMCFAVLSLSQLFHSFNMRSRHSLFRIGLFSNPHIFLSFLFCAFLQIVVITFPPLASLFKVACLTPFQWGAVLLFSTIPIFLVELQKRGRKMS